MIILPYTWRNGAPITCTLLSDLKCLHFQSTRNSIDQDRITRRRYSS